MKVIALIVSLTSLVALTSAQRGHYAGSRPILNGIKGPFPDVPQQQQNVDNRFNDNSLGNEAAQPLNSNANSNPNLLPQYNPYNNMHFVNHFNHLPQDQHPFWLLNNEAINGFLNRPQQLNVQPMPNQGSFFNGRRRR